MKHLNLKKNCYFDLLYDCGRHRNALAWRACWPMAIVAAADVGISVLLKKINTAATASVR